MPICPCHERVVPVLLPAGGHVSRDSVRADMLLFDLPKAGESVVALLKTVERLSSLYRYVYEA